MSTTFLFALLLATAGGGPSVAGCAWVARCACGHGEGTGCRPVVNRLALATPAAVIMKVATKMPRFIYRPEFCTTDNSRTTSPLKRCAPTWHKLGSQEQVGRIKPIVT